MRTTFATGSLIRNSCGQISILSFARVEPIFIPSMKSSRPLPLPFCAVNDRESTITPQYLAHPSVSRDGASFSHRNLGTQSRDGLNPSVLMENIRESHETNSVALSPQANYTDWATALVDEI
jgi:hypothetical protein